MLKGIALVLIFLCCTGTGLFCALRTRRRIELIRDSATAIRALSVDVAAARAPADSLLEKHFSSLLGEKERSKMKNKIALISDGEEAMLLLEFLEEFGSGGIESEQMRCSIVANRLQAILERDEEDCRKRQQLFFSGGIIAGIFFGILAL